MKTFICSCLLVFVCVLLLAFFTIRAVSINCGCFCALLLMSRILERSLYFFFQFILA
jgi:hypothetical protein